MIKIGEIVIAKKEGLPEELLAKGLGYRQEIFYIFEMFTWKRNKMKVKELKEILEAADPDAEIHVVEHDLSPNYSPYGHYVKTFTRKINHATMGAGDNNKKSILLSGGTAYGILLSPFYKIVSDKGYEHYKIELTPEEKEHYDKYHNPATRERV